MARESASERLRWVFDLYEFGEDSLRSSLRRRFPGSSAPSDRGSGRRLARASARSRERGRAGDTRRLAAKPRLNRWREAVASIAAELDRVDAQWAVVGGIAVGARAEPRTTRDVDLAIAVDGDREAEALIRQLLRAGYETVSLVEHASRSRLATVRLRRRDQ